MHYSKTEPLMTAVGQTLPIPRIGGTSAWLPNSDIKASAKSTLRAITGLPAVPQKVIGAIADVTPILAAASSIEW